jgi:hypothetical protein
MQSLSGGDSLNFMYIIIIPESYYIYTIFDTRISR